MFSCKKETEVERANREGILLVGNSAEPRALDLQLVSGVPEGKILSSLYEGLIADHPSEDETMVPGMAESWEHNEDYTEWTFRIRKNARWSDDTPFTADDFVFSYHRMLHPQLAAQYASMLHILRNAKAYNLDHRVEILCGLDPEFPASRDILRKINLQGEEASMSENWPALASWMEADFNSLDRTAKKAILSAKGLDRMRDTHLDAILRDPSLFDWPDEIDETTRTLIVERLLSHIRAGEPDLYEKAQLGFHAPDSHTLVLELESPVPYLLSMTRHTSWLPVPRHVILKHGRISDRFTEWSNEKNLVGNGAFVLKQWRFNHYIEVRKNPLYWDAPRVKLNGIRFYPIDNPYTEARAFLAGQLHTIYSLPADLIAHTKKHHPESLRTEPYVGTVFLRINTTRPGLNHPKVRQALALAINRAELCEHIYEGFTPATGLTPKLGDYDPVDCMEFDIEKAKVLLAEAGYPGGRGLPTFVLLSSSRPTPSVDALQAYFSKIGVRVTLEKMDWGSFIATQRELNYDISIGGWIGDYLDATTFLDLWTKGNGNNTSGWSSDEYESLLNQASYEPDPKRRSEILREAERLVLDAVPLIPIAWYSRVYLHRPEVKGWHPLVLDNHPWSRISLQSRP